MATGAPILKLHITPENWEDAKQASSGGCLVADAIKKQYGFASVSVDMATIRATDRKKGFRYTWLTPESGQTVLLAFDQGWEQPHTQVQTGRAVQITPVRIKDKSKAAKVKEELAELDAKVAAGEKLTAEEKKQRTRLKRQASRAVQHGPKTVSDSGQIQGGRGLRQGEPHPNLLRGRNRLFGAKSAKPAEAFMQAVDAAVEERVAAHFAELKAAESTK